VISGPFDVDILTLTWDSSTNQIYNVETNANMVVPIWGIAETVTGTVASITVTTAVEQVQMFYKVTTP
jgi:hypothetical protein